MQMSDIKDPDKNYYDPDVVWDDDDEEDFICDDDEDNRFDYEDEEDFV